MKENLNVVTAKELTPKQERGIVVIRESILKLLTEFDYLSRTSLSGHTAPYVYSYDLPFSIWSTILADLVEEGAVTVSTIGSGRQQKRIYRLATR